jgi:HD-GYP domain-containing protein (c-di-GMP phosphodiesterase class II)
MKAGGAGHRPAPPDGIPVTEVPTTAGTASRTLSLALAALRRHLAQHTVDFRATPIADIDRSRELVAALAGSEETSTGARGAVAGAGTATDERAGSDLKRVCRYALMLTARVAPEHASDPQFAYGFLLHDIGELTLPPSVLAKVGDYTDAEWELTKQHPEAGWSVLEDIPFLAEAREIVVAHHERWDGKGYPRGLVGAEIPLGARILQLCDAFNAMTKDRPHHRASSIADARGEIHRGRGKQFWPVAVDGLLSLPVEELEAVRGAYRGRPT